MQGTFSQVLLPWQTFYFTLAGAAATLTGLLFVAVSLHLSRIMDKNRAELRLLAAQTFANFIFLLLTALYFLIPYPDSWGLALALTITSLGALGSLGAQGPGGLRAARQNMRQSYLFWRLSLPGLGYVAMIVVAGLLWLGNTGILYLVAPALLILLGACARNAWDLLVRAGEEEWEARRTGEDGDPQLRRVEQQLRAVTRRQRQITRQQEDAGRQAGVLPPRRRG